MSLFADLRERARTLLFSRRREEELAEEIRFHIERDAQERIRRGANPEEARRASRAAFGGVDAVKEAVRDASGVRPLQDLVADFRYALRSLTRDPIYASAAIAVLSLGLGAGATVFSVADAVVFSKLPYREPDRLVRVGQLYQQNATVWQLSTVDAQAIVEQQRSFEAFGLASFGDAALSGAGAPVKISVGRVTSGFFRALGVLAASGREIAPADESPDAPPVAVVTHRLAEERLGGPAAALGRGLTLDGLSYTVVGVLPAGLDELAGVRASAWPALKLRPPERRGPFWLRGFGRLREGVSLEAATRDLAVTSERIFPMWASSFQDRTARIAPVPLRDSIVGGASRSVGLFGAAVALVLLVAIVNVTTLSLARASARESELAMRVALGASRLRLARLPVIEGLVLSFAAGLVGLGLAALGLPSLSRLAPNLPRIQDVTLDGSTMAFLAVAALVTGLLASLSPLLAAMRGFTACPRSGDRRRTGPDRRTVGLRTALVVTEFALALPLLLGASLLFRSFLELQRVDPGFDPAGVLGVSLALPEARYPDDEQVQELWRQLELRARALPGLSGAGISSSLPPDGNGNINNFNLIDRPVAPGVAEHLVPWSFVTPGYFEALGVQLLEGRLFLDGDSADAAPVVLVSRSWAERYYPGESAVGRQMVEGGCTTCPPTTVIGVVEDVKYVGLTESSDAVYSPLVQTRARRAWMVVRSRDLPEATFARLRDLVGRLDPELPLDEQTMDARLDRALAGPGRSAAVIAAFSFAAVILAALAIFGLLSYVVRQRQREIGVRIALGASPGAIVRMIVGQGMSYASIGTFLGLGLAWLATRWLGSFLFGVSATDPVTTLAVTALLLIVAALACVLPGFRASRIQLAEAIAAE